MRLGTQIRLVAQPVPYSAGPFGTYLVPADHVCVFWQEGTSPVTAPLLHSYFHTHEAWAKEMRLYVGASASSLDMSTLYPQGASLAAYHSQEARTRAEAQLERNAARVGAALVCRYRRSAQLFEVQNGTAEIADRFYRAAGGCVPFHLRKGMPWVALIVTGPDSDAAAQAHSDDAHPDAMVGALHTYIRLFVHVEDATRATFMLHGAENNLTVGPHGDKLAIG